MASDKVGKAPELWTPRRPWLLRRLDKRVEKREKPGLSRDFLNAEEIIAGARKRSGIGDIPVDDIREPLEILVRSYREEAALRITGRKGASDFLQGVLGKRLQVLDLLRRNPEVERIPIDRPVFIIGHHRSGTTLLQHLLAELPPIRPLRTWELYTVPPSRPLPFDSKIRLLATHLGNAAFNWAVPDFKQIHEMRAGGPEEGVPLLFRSFCTYGCLLTADLPSYEKWLDDCPSSVFEERYRFFRRQVQLMLWRGAAAGAVVLEKSPLHLSAIDELVRVFPDARIIHVHRHLGRVVPSAASLVAVSRSLFSDRLDFPGLGRFILRLVRRNCLKELAFRQRFPADQVVDVDYCTFIRDPKAMIRRIVEYFDLPAPEDLDDRLDHRLGLMPQNKHGRHRYSLERFGLTPADIEELDRGYHKYFSVSSEPLPREE
ncbi:MAG: hypothetical protein GKR89_17200 [Candidatus Latescibacteria bacterium]|nr:hypothetical protein [Candidatus Latescibacterota bacterium]